MDMHAEARKVGLDPSKFRDAHRLLSAIMEQRALPRFLCRGPVPKRSSRRLAVGSRRARAVRWKARLAGAGVREVERRVAQMWAGLPGW